MRSSLALCMLGVASKRLAGCWICIGKEGIALCSNFAGMQRTAQVHGMGLCCSRQETAAFIVANAPELNATAEAPESAYRPSAGT